MNWAFQKRKLFTLSTIAILCVGGCSKSQPEPEQLEFQVQEPGSASDAELPQVKKKEKEKSGDFFDYLASGSQPSQEKQNTEETPENSEAKSDDATSSKQPEDEPENFVADWVDKVRFWDMYRRIRSKAAKTPLTLSLEKKQLILKHLDSANELQNHVKSLATQCQFRSRILQDRLIHDHFVQMIREGTPLPDWLHQSRFYNVEYEVTPNDVGSEFSFYPLEVALIREQVTAQHLLDLLVCMKGNLADLAALRELEMRIDLPLLYFNPYQIEFLEVETQGNAYLVGIREHRDLYLKYGPTYSDRYSQYLDDERLLEQTKIYQQSDFENVEKVCQQLEKMIGGLDPRFRFPKYRLPRSRREIVEHSKKLLQIVQRSDQKAFSEVFGGDIEKARNKKKNEYSDEANNAYLYNDNFRDQQLEYRKQAIRQYAEFIFPGGQALYQQAPF